MAIIGSVLEKGRKIAKIGLAMGAKIGGAAENWQEKSFVNDNACEADAKIVCTT